MKHIFSIHSPLTFLVAYSVIEHLELQHEDVILISSNYQVPIRDFKVAQSFPERYARNIWQKLRYFNLPVNFDRYIDELTQGQDFTAYIDLMSYYQRILVTHSKCQQFHFIEEGNSTYQQFDDLTDITWHERRINFRHEGVLKSFSRVIRGYNLRLLGMPYIYSAYTYIQGISFYALSNNAFYNAPKEKKVLLRPSPASAAMKQFAAGIELKDEVIWIDGSNARYTGLPDSFYEEAIQKAIHQFKNLGIYQKTIHVKLRPKVTDYQENTLIRVLERNGFEVQVLPDNLILEAVFIRSKNCHVLGTLTSALEYAYIFNHKAYSIYGLFEKQPPTFFDRMTGFWENIQKLEA